MSTSLVSRWLGRAAAIVAMFWGDANGESIQPAGEPLPASTAVAENRPPFLYLRSSATGFDVSDAYRLRPTADPRLFELSLVVEEPWMVSEGMEVQLTETRSRDRWEDGHDDYLLDHPVIVGVDRRSHLSRPSSGVMPARLERVHFPRAGHYHVRVHWPDRTITFYEEGSSDPSVEVWSSQGTLVVDGLRRLFRADFSGLPVLSRVDRDTGRALWSRGDLDTAFVDATCVFPEAIVLRGATAVVAIAPESGETLWSNDLGGALAEPSAYAFARCDSRRDSVQIIFGNEADSHQLATISRATGATRWTRSMSTYFSVVAATDDVVVTRQSQVSGMRVTALDVRSGAEVWSLDSTERFTLQASPSGEVYFSNGHQIRQIDPRTGADRWRLTTESDLPWLTFEAGLTFVRDELRVVKIDTSSGVELWAHRLERSPDRYPTVTVLRSGRVVITRQSSAEGTTELAHLDPDRGSVTWSRVLALPYAWPDEDAEGRLYARGATFLTRLETSTGEMLWTFTLPPPLNPQYFGPGMSSVAASDPSSVFVLVQGAGYRYPPMSLVALDAATGVRRWQHDEAGSIQVVDSDSARLYVQTGYFAPRVAALNK